MTYLSTPLMATGWNETLVNDSDGNTILLMPNGHKGLEAVKEATALFAAAPDLLAALETLVSNYPYWASKMEMKEIDKVAIATARAAIAKARGEVA